MENVSWDGIMEEEGFLAKLNAAAKTRGDLPDGWEYSLPTEAQWEYACRAGTTTNFNWGDNILNGTRANCDGEGPDGTNENGPSLGRTVRVGSYAKNQFDLFDMHGNVREWCLDVYKSELKSGPDPVQLEGEKGAFRVRRGGCWVSFAGSCRSGLRDGFHPVIRYEYLGFRPVLVPSSSRPKVAPATRRRRDWGHMTPGRRRGATPVADDPKHAGGRVFFA